MKTAQSHGRLVQSPACHMPKQPGPEKPAYVLMGFGRLLSRPRFSYQVRVAGVDSGSGSFIAKSPLSLRTAGFLIGSLATTTAEKNCFP